MNRRIPSESNEQEGIILKYLSKNSYIKSRKVEELLNIKESRTRELLKQMVDKDYIARHGQGRSTFYTLKNK
jgi:predicted HTH transcriptional regulator